MVQLIWLIVAFWVNFAQAALNPVFILNRDVPGTNDVLSPAEFTSVLQYYSGKTLDTNSQQVLKILDTFEYQMLADPTEIIALVNYEEESLGEPSFYITEDSNDIVKQASTRVYSAESTEFTDFLYESSKSVRKNVIVIGVNSRNIRRSVSESKRQETTIPAAFFTTQEDCEAGTNNCTGHGSCVKQGNSMYACKCVASQSEDGKTIKYGGNDCSKRDISFQFNLIVGTTLAIFVAGALSISLLMKLGSEPLPGILTTI